MHSLVDCIAIICGIYFSATKWEEKLDQISVSRRLSVEVAFQMQSQWTVQCMPQQQVNESDCTDMIV